MAADFRARMMAWWQVRNSRERLFLQVGGGIVLFGLLYGALYVPLDSARTRLAERLERLRAEHRLVVAQVEAIDQLKRSVSRSGLEGADLQRRIESSARARDFLDNEVSVVPLGRDRVQFSATERPVRDWLEWLLELQLQGVSVDMLRMRMSEVQDWASIEVTFSRESP